MAAFCRRSPDSPTQMLSTSLDTRISRMGLLALASFCEGGNNRQRLLRATRLRSPAAIAPGGRALAATAHAPPF